MGILLFAAVLLYFGGIVYLANQDDLSGTASPSLRWMLYGAIGLGLLNGLMVLQSSLLTVPEGALPIEMPPATDRIAATVGFAFTLLVMSVSLGAVVSVRMRVGIRRLVGAGVYNPDSPVHLTAVVLALTLLSITIGQLILSGGLSGLAQSYAEGVPTADLLFQQVLWLVFAFLGIGAFIRRSGLASLKRLGLRLPTVADAVVGIGAGLGLFAGITALGALWVLFSTPEQIEAQTAASEQLAAAFGTTLPLALVLSIGVALGEEVFFRGALQPVFGLGLTSVFFALLHTQYTLTPASIGIFFVSLGMGWLRERYSTTAAIFAHFAYNFIQLALVALANNMALNGG